MDAQRFRSLSPRQRALVAVAVLLDGREAGMYLENDAVNGQGLKRAALDLAGVEPDLRMPLVGTLLRDALKEMR
jgi:hypothetical protein